MNEVLMDEPAAPADEAFLMPASVSQKRFWLLEQMTPGNTALNIPIAFDLEGPLDLDVLQRALQAIVDRHEILRTRFELIDGEPHQVIAAHATITLEHVTVGSAGDRAARVREALNKEAARPVDFNRPPLMRAALFKVSPSDHVLMLTQHHIVSDGWSNGILIRELAAFYDAIRRDAEPSLPPLAIQYADYVLWQNEWLATPGFRAQLDFWRAQFAGEIPVLDMPTDFPRQSAQPPGAVLEARLLPAALTESVRRVCQEEGVTLFMIFLTTYVALLHRYTGQDRLLLGTTAANRNKPELEALVGLFANLLVLPAEASSTMTFRELLAKQRDASLNGFANHEAPFELVLQESGASKVPMQTHFLFQRAFMQPQTAGDLRIKPVHSVSPGSTFELTFGIVERAEGIRLQMEYRTSLYRNETIKRMLQHFEQILEAAAAHPETPIGDISLFAENEREEIEARLASVLGSRGDVNQAEVLAYLDSQLESHWLSGREIFAPVIPPEHVVLAATDERGHVAPLDLFGRVEIALPGAAAPEATPFLGRNSDAGVELWGRAEDLIHINGFRFNRRMIETHLRAHPQVAKAAVTMQKRLAAQVVLRAGATTTVNELREWLKGRVSDLLVPASLRIVLALGEFAGEDEVVAQTKSPGAVPLQALLQQQLLEIWQRLLKTDSLDADSNFFEVGGNSFLALRMMTEAEKLARQPLPLSLLLRGATVRDLARHILEGVNEQSAEIIPVQSTGSRTPLFFLHGDWIGGGFYCNRLARDMGGDQPFYALPPFHMRDERIVTMADMAAQHVAALRKERPHGPYLIGGYCIGAVVAIEVARQLIRDGETVEHVLLVDPPLWGGVFLAGLWPWIDRLGNRKSWNLERKITVFDQTAVTASRWWRRPLRSKFGAVLNRLGITLKTPENVGTTRDNGDGAEILEGLDFSTYYMSYRLHRFAAIHVPTTLFFSGSTSEARVVQAPGLTRIDLAKLKVERIPGNHTTCITEHTDDLAAAMRKAIG